MKKVFSFEVNRGKLEPLKIEVRLTGGDDQQFLRFCDAVGAEMAAWEKVICNGKEKEGSKKSRIC